MRSVSKNIKNNSDYGSQRHMDAGQLVPTRCVIEMVQNRLNKDDVKGGFMLDGFQEHSPKPKNS